MNWASIILTFLSGCVFGAATLALAVKRLISMPGVFDRFVLGYLSSRRSIWESKGLCPDCGQDHIQEFGKRHHGPN